MCKEIYIGSVSNIQRRLEEHNSKRGRHFTASLSGKWNLIYKEELESKKIALVREKELKSYKGREYIGKFIGHEA